MISIIKSQPAPECKKKKKQKTNGNYKCGEVVERIKEDFGNKCYICEYKEPPTINVEHFVPHKGENELKFDWNNLFYSCGHCNNTKLDKFDFILNCTNPEHDVENWIKYEMKPFPKEKVKISAQKDDEMVTNTVRLLMDVYNGTTQLKIIESSNIRQALLNEIREFQNHLFGYYDDENEDDEKKIHFEKIKKQLKKLSPFTAFKRWIIKDNPVLRKDFEHYFD